MVADHVEEGMLTPADASEHLVPIGKILYQGFLV